MSRSCRSALVPVVLGVFFLPFLLLHAQVDDGRLYNPPKLDIAGWLTSGLYLGADPSPFGAPIVVTQQMELKFETMLPMIFFDAPGSTVPAPRYRLLSSPSDAAHYSDTLPMIVPAVNQLFDHYMSEGMISKPSRRYEVLDVIGARLRRFPDAELDIEGGYTGGIEDTSVAMRRAEFVRDHFLSVWGIAPGRLHILPPAMLSRPGASLAQEQEGRRVTMYSRNARLFDPMVFHYLQNSGPFLHLSAALDPRFAPEDIRSVELSVAVGSALVYRDWLQPNASSRYQIDGVVPIYWMIDNPVDPVVAQAVVTLNDGRQFTSNQARLPFDVHLPERLYWIDSTMRVYNDDGIFLMAFQEMGTSRFGPHQDRLLREACDSIHSIMDNPWGNKLWLDQREQDSSERYDEVVGSMETERESEGDGSEGDGSVPVAVPESLTKVDSTLFQVIDPPREPRIHIYGYTDAMEVIADSMLAEYEYAMRSSEVGERYYRAFQQEIAAAVMSPAVPPRMVVISNGTASTSNDASSGLDTASYGEPSEDADEEDGRGVLQFNEMMTQWLGFDPEARESQIDEAIEEAIGKLPHDSVWSTSSYQADSGLNARAQVLTKARIVAARNRLMQILGRDSNRVQLQCDTNEVNLNGLHDLRELMLPENRLLERVLRVEVSVGSATYPELPHHDEEEEYPVDTERSEEYIAEPDTAFADSIDIAVPLEDSGSISFSMDTAKSDFSIDATSGTSDTIPVAIPNTAISYDTVVKSTGAGPGRHPRTPLPVHQRTPPATDNRDGLEVRRP